MDIKEKVRYYLQVNRKSGNQTNSTKKNSQYKIKEIFEEIKIKKNIVGAYIRKVTFNENNQPYRDELQEKLI